MGKACRRAGTLTSGRHPDLHPDFALIYARQGAMTLVADHLVGRADELGSLDRVLAELDQGAAGAIELVGEAGIGKTRLLAEFANRADAEGRLVLSGSASELERDLPFSVFVDALDDYLGGLDSGPLARLREDVRTELAHVF